MLQTSNSPCTTHTRIPKTPMRRFFCRLELFRPNLALGKRSREPEHASSSWETCTPSTSEAELAGLTLNSSVPATGDANQDNPALSPTPVLDEKTLERARIAFQLHDRPLDAVVVTTLPNYPFVRHEDLITMTRQQLVDVAVLFNAHLPQTIQIDCSEGAAASHIRHCIETLVGLIPPNVPGAPKAPKSRAALERVITPDVYAGDENVDIIPSPPTSPLAMRLTKRQGLAHISTSSGLDCVEEEDLFTSRTRVLKRRKLSDATEVPSRSMYETDTDITPIRALRLSPKPGTSPSADIWSRRKGSSKGTDLSPWSGSSYRLKNKDRRGPFLKAPCIEFSAMDRDDEEAISLEMSGLGPPAFYSYTDGDDRMDFS